MSDSQFEALLFMFVVGLFGLPLAAEKNGRVIRTIGMAWTAVWWLPPLAMLWVKGVFG